MVGDDSTNILRGVADAAVGDDDGTGAVWRAAGDGRPVARARAEVLPVRTSTAASPGALLLALQLGVFSGVLLAMLAAAHLPAVQDSPLTWRLAAASGALLSAWVMARHARSLFTVLERGLVLGALEWLALGLFGLPRALPEALALDAVHDTLASGLLTEGPSSELLSGPVALVLAGLCLVGWLFVGRLHREWALDEPD